MHAINESLSKTSKLRDHRADIIKSTALTPSWVELPGELTANILSRVGAVDVLENVQKVCTTWRSVCLKDPSMWRVIDMTNSGDIYDIPYDLVRMCRQAVDRSQGQLININIEFFCSGQLLRYISDRCKRLKSVRIACCMRLSGKDVVMAVKNLPQLEELHILFVPQISAKDIEAIGCLCPLLRSFTYTELNQCFPLIKYDEYALSIGRSMPGLRQLNLFGNTMTNTGLQAILDGCQQLESLDLRRCFNVNIFQGNSCSDSIGIAKRCFLQINDLKRPSDKSVKDNYDLSKVSACLESLKVFSDPSYCE